MTRLRVSLDGHAAVAGQHFADGWLVADAPAQIASDGPVVATVGSIDPDPPDGPAAALAALLDAGLTLPQAVDYWAVEHCGWTETDWGAARGVGQQTVSQHCIVGDMELDG